MDTALPQKFPFTLDRNLAKANCTGNRVCTSCDTGVLAAHGSSKVTRPSKVFNWQNGVESGTWLRLLSLFHDFVSLLLQMKSLQGCVATEWRTDWVGWTRYPVGEGGGGPWHPVGLGGGVAWLHGRKLIGLVKIYWIAIERILINILYDYY